MSDQSINWSAADLEQVYSTARRFKEEVYRRWIDTLSGFLPGPDAGMRAEAIRRIEYLESHFLRA